MTVVVPTAFPLIVRLSDPELAEPKFASRVTIPTDEKTMPEIVSSSSVSESSPMLSVPPCHKFKLDTTATECAPVPKLIVAPDLIFIVCQFSKVPLTKPDTFSNSSVSTPAPPSISVTAAKLPPENDNLSFPAPRFTLPVIEAPVLTIIVAFVWKIVPVPKLIVAPDSIFIDSQFSKVPLTTPDTFSNSSLSVPAPPSISVTAAKLPPENVSVSFPAPRFTLPAMVAPLLTITIALPAVSMMALRPAAPTEAPLLSETVTVVPEEASVLIAASLAAEPPVTAPDAEIETPPAPEDTALIPYELPVTAAAVMVSDPPLEFETRPKIPSAPVPVTKPVALMSSVPEPPWRASIPDLPVTATTSIVMSSALAELFTLIPASAEPVTALPALMETEAKMLAMTLIPALPPVTVAAVTVSDPERAKLETMVIPLSAVPITVPEVEIETLPLP